MHGGRVALKKQAPAQEATYARIGWMVRKVELKELVMNLFKILAKKIPGAVNLYRSLRGGVLSLCSKNNGHKNIFTDIFNGNKFGGKDSISGPGSDLWQTRVIIKELPPLFRELRVSTLLDIPCGDFHWMNEVELDEIEYIGADIVKDLIKKNKKNYERKTIHFKHLSLIDDKLPKVDLILCRDCLVHLPFKDIWQTLRNICLSKSEYLLTTTFPAREENRDILIGQWRPLNLQLPPFSFPEPLKIMNEACKENAGAYSDKSLGLWQVKELEKSLTKHRI